MSQGQYACFLLQIEMARQRLVRQQHELSQKEQAVQKISVELKRREKDVNDGL